MAPAGAASSPFLFGGTDPAPAIYAHFHFEGVGWGGRHGMDGNNMVVAINGNCRNTPVEVFETRYPSFRIESYLTPAAIPAARAVARRSRRRARPDGHRPEVTVSALLNRMKADPWGVLGGGNGAVAGSGCAARDRTSGARSLRTSARSPLEVLRRDPAQGDQVKILMPGGGGYGDPRRERERVRRDVEEGSVSGRQPPVTTALDGTG